MADVITRFKLETNQFDSALRDASNGLVNITKQLSLAGKDFDKFAQKDIEVARSLGQVESGANNLKDKLRDLVSAYNNVAKAYNNLTKEQQQGDFGKAMAASLDQLQSRITQTKNELYGMSDSTKQAGGSLGSLNDIFGMSITKLAGWGTAIAGAKGALDVAKDAFFASEQNIDAWGQTVEAGQAVYESFLTSINSGDISGFLSRIGQITNAAIEAYNALDQLNTQKTIQSPQVAVKQAEISRMRTMLQTGRYVAPADGRSTGGMKTGDVLTKEQIANISKNLEQALNEVATITRSQVKTASTAIDKLYAEQAAVLGVSKQRFQQATSSWENFQAAMDNANKYERWKKENTTYTTQTTSTGAVIRTASYDDSKNPYRDWAWVSRFKDDGERFHRLIQEIQNRESAKSTLYSQYGQAYRRINRAEGVNPYGNVGGGSAADKTNTELKQNEASIAKLTEQYQKLATEAKTADDAQRAGISTRMKDIQSEIKLLSDRNAELKRFAAEAQGMKVSVGISSSLPELNEQLKQLQQAQSQALNNADWTAYGKQIEQVQAQIEALKGKWKEGLQATFRIKAEVPEEKTVVFKADDTDVLEKARQISGVHIDDKTLTVTALTEDAEVALRNLDGMKPQTKFLTVTALTAEAEESLRKMGAEQVGDKTFRVTAEMADTLTQLQDVNAYKISDKTLTVTALTAEAEESLRKMGAEQIGDKTFRITAEMADTLTQLQQVNAYHIDDKTLTVTALTAEAEESLRRMGAERIGDKTFRVTAEMADTITQLQQVNAYHISDKEVAVNAETQAAIDKLKEIEGVTFDPKTLTVTANTAEAYNKCQELFKDIEGTTVEFSVVPKVQEMAVGVNIQNSEGLSQYISQLQNDLKTADFGSQLYNSIAEQLADMSSLQSLVTESMKQGLGTAMFDVADEAGADFWTRAMEGGVDNIDWQGIVDKINEARKANGLDAISLDFDTGNIKSVNKLGTEMAKDFQGAASAIGQLGSAMSNIEDPAAKVFGIVSQAIATVALTFAKSLKGTVTPWDWIAAAISGTATMIATISSIKSATSGNFAEGGIVPGNHFSGDNMRGYGSDGSVYGLNSGELILNRSQQDHIAGQLIGGQQQGVQSSRPYTTGEQIYLGLSAYLSRTGKGELVTSKG